MHRTVTAWLFTLTACAVVMPTAAHNTDGRWNYLAADMREWFKGLHAPRTGTPCCDEADGWRVDDVDWELKDGHYRVRVYGKWIPVPDDTVITEPNRFGPAVVWPYVDLTETTQIRCFLPGQAGESSSEIYPYTTGKVMGAARRNEHGAALARSGQAR